MCFIHLSWKGRRLDSTPLVDRAVMRRLYVEIKMIRCLKRAAEECAVGCKCSSLQLLSQPADHGVGACLGQFDALRIAGALIFNGVCRLSRTVLLPSLRGGR